ncbi:MAG: hypothetical protein ACYC9R_06205 [Nitrosotalea sp.]
MPITFNKETGWEIVKPTKDESLAILLIGKAMIVEGLAGAYTSEKYKKWLKDSPQKNFFNA